jgi:hypothetical protein
MSTAIARFDVTGTDVEVGLARDAIERCTYDFGLLKDRVKIKFIAASKIANVPGTTSPALAFCRASIRTLEIRSGLRKRTTRSVVLHEIGHMVDADNLRRTKRAALMSLMDPLGEQWGQSPYRARPSECFAETFVRAFSDVPSALKDYYQRRIRAIKWDAYREIVLRQVPADTTADEPLLLEPEDDPPTLPEEEPAVRQPVNVVANQIGTIAKGTPFFHPDTGVRITTAQPGGDFDLVGETDDGQFRFAVVETGQLVSGQTIRALFLVETAKVTDVRSRPIPGTSDLATKLETAKQKAREIAEL